MLYAISYQTMHVSFMSASRAGDCYYFGPDGAGVGGCKLTLRNPKKESHQLRRPAEIFIL